jgi:hypothetical protein
MHRSTHERIGYTCICADAFGNMPGATAHMCAHIRLGTPRKTHHATHAHTHAYMTNAYEHEHAYPHVAHDMHQCQHTCECILPCVMKPLSVATVVSTGARMLKLRCTAFTAAHMCNFCLAWVQHTWHHEHSNTSRTCMPCPPGLLCLELGQAVGAPGLAHILTGVRHDTGAITSTLGGDRGAAQDGK